MLLLLISWQPHYLWDKKHNLVQVQWDNKTAITNNQTLEGAAYQM
jgi:hypothetical protein